MMANIAYQMISFFHKCLNSFYFQYRTFIEIFIPILFKLDVKQPVLATTYLNPSIKNIYLGDNVSLYNSAHNKLYVITV